MSLLFAAACGPAPALRSAQRREYEDVRRRRVWTVGAAQQVSPVRRAERPRQLDLYEAEQTAGRACQLRP